MLKSEELTTFQWLAPSMVRDGLLKNGDWVLPAADEAPQMFVDEKHQLAAQFLAVLERYALDYIRQAPVLVIAASDGRDLKRREHRLEVGRRFIAECRAGMKLADLMRSYKLAPQLRALKGFALMTGDTNLLQAISEMLPASTLAQIIPKTAQEQYDWLRVLLRWRDHMGRHFRSSNLFLDWAAINLRDERSRQEWTEVADFAGRNRATFNLEWSFQEAHAAAERWHDEMAVCAPVYESSRPDWRTIIDYGTLPTRTEIDGLTFVALQTRETLYEEGARMHHCVRLYSDRVANGTSRIFGVRRGDTRVATLELVRMSRSDASVHRYRLAQLKGPCNRRAEAAVNAATIKFLEKVNPPVPAAGRSPDQVERGDRSRAALRSILGEDVAAAWFSHMNFEAFDGRTLRVLFPTRFLVRWVQVHYTETLLASCAEEFPGVERIEIAQDRANAVLGPSRPSFAVPRAVPA